MIRIDHFPLFKCKDLMNSLAVPNETIVLGLHSRRIKCGRTKDDAESILSTFRTDQKESVGLGLTELPNLFAGSYFVIHFDALS